MTKLAKAKKNENISQNNSIFLGLSMETIDDDDDEDNNNNYSLKYRKQQRTNYCHGEYMVMFYI